MSPEMEHSDFREEFEAIIQTGDNKMLSEFLDDQNISEVAELIHDDPDHELAIISSMSVHRAASVFKILELANQKNIIKKLSPHKTAALLHELSPDDSTDFLEE